MITKTDITNFCKELKTKYKSALQTITMEIVTDDHNEKQLRLVTILIKKSQRNKGFGHKIMQEITLFSDKFKIPIELKAVDIYGSDLDRLFNFYKNHNFFSIGKDYMKRLPKT